MTRTLLFLAALTLLLPAAPRPNVLFIAIDDLNDWTGALGGHPQAKTPQLDRLAARGTLFTNAHCQSPVCNPSRSSLLLGRLPHRSGLHFLNPDFKKIPALAELPTLPEVFAAHGYLTLGVGKIHHTGSQRFFQKYGGSFGGFGPTPKEKISQPHGHPLWDWGAFPERDELMPDYQSASWAISELRKKHDKPFFLAVGFVRPHVPMFVPKKWFDLHPLTEIKLPEIAENDLADISPYARNLTTLEHVSPTHQWVSESGEWKHAVQSYLASTSFVDHQVGRLLDALAESPHRDNTLIVLFSDHGFHLGEKNHWAKRTLWEDSTRVPLIIAGPGLPTRQRSDAPAGLIDLFPTLLDLAGLPADPTQHGRSLRPLLNDPAADWPHPAITSFGPGNITLRSRHHRLIRYHDGSEELYDHRRDPHEWHNLLPLDPATSSEVRPVYEALRRQVPGTEAPLIPGDSTGHKAYQAAKEKL
ncbi:MAG: sulfatase [Verrucomicrobiales bacterium]